MKIFDELLSRVPFRYLVLALGGLLLVLAGFTLSGKWPPEIHQRSAFSPLYLVLGGLIVALAIFLHFYDEQGLFLAGC
jgi:hypothetical protein